MQISLKRKQYWHDRYPGYSICIAISFYFVVRRVVRESWKDLEEGVAFLE